MDGYFAALKIPDFVERCVVKSRTGTDARNKDSVIFVLISRTNFRRNFVRIFGCNSPGFKVQRDN
jgi:hypothetical protein